MTQDLNGKTFGDWLVLEVDLLLTKNHAKWFCACKCGVQKSVYQCHLLSGKSKSCSTHGKHGIGRGTEGYTSWSSMISRCTNSKHVKFSNYGGRGIQVCERWMEFANFYADMGPRPEGASIDRIDGDGNYEPANCRWATLEEQNNNKSNNARIEYNGTSYTYANLARHLGISYAALIGRVNTGKQIDAPYKPRRSPRK